MKLAVRDKDGTHTTVGKYTGISSKGQNPGETLKGNLHILS